MTVTNGSLVLTNDDSSDPPVYAWQAVTTVVGQTYELKVHFSGGTVSPNLAVYLNSSSSFGGDAGGSITADSVSGNGIKTLQFTSQHATTYVLVRVNANSAGTAIFSAVSIKAADYGDTPKLIPPYGVDAGNTFNGAISMNSPSYMYFPTGRTEERGRGVGLYAGGTTPSTDPTPQIASILIQSSGNSIQFGDLSVARYVGGTGASSTRGIFAGGATPTRLNTIDFVTISTQGNATDFGDTQQVVSGSTGVSNSTRMVNAGGDSPAPTLIDVMGFLTIASLGDATDFGNLSVARAGLAGGASPTRGVFGGGWSAVPAYTGNDTIDFITIATTGNAADFGNLTTARRSVSGGSSQTRAIFMGGKSGSNPSSTKTNIIDFVTIASTGDATDFGDLTATVRDSGQTMSNSIRACKAAGYNSPATVNNIDMVTIATTGYAVDFGDTVIPVYSLTGLSDSHGGL